MTDFFNEYIRAILQSVKNNEITKNRNKTIFSPHAWKY